MDTRNSPTNSLSPAAFEKLLQNRQEFLGFLERRLQSREDAEDILQLAFIRGIERGSRLRDEESVVAWFYRVLRNAVIDHYRRTVAADRVMEEWGDDLDRVADPNGTLKESICGCLAQVIPDLKAEYRQALEIVDLDEGTLGDLVKKANITPTNAAVRVHRARLALKKQVELACGACAEHHCLECSCRGNIGGRGFE